jgi:uncharacterized membrane protein YeiB
MSYKKKRNNHLTKKEQSTTTAYKMMSEKINGLEASLKKTQDESETIRVEKYEIEKKHILLEQKLKNRLFITFLEFISSAGFGFALSFISTNLQTAVSIGAPSLIVYLICIYLTKK